MGKNLVVVESPAKAETLKKYLGKDYEILASYGHVRDLEPKEGAVDPDNNFAMKYALIEKNTKRVEAIARAMRKANALYLATDPDREGEAISWHLYEVLKTKKALDDKPVHRVVFHEITKPAILEAIAHPRSLSLELVNAQQARRALDYLVGFNLSPLLWKKVRRGLSAGRVQSPALRLIVEREEEIERFKTREYWTIEADLESRKENFGAKLTHYAGNKVTQFSIMETEQAHQVTAELLRAAGGVLVVTHIERKQRRRNPAAPFITSTLQQEAVRKLGFTAERCMRVAQQLYEGIDTVQGPLGLITYMRTDSVNLANEAIHEIRDFITERYGEDNLPKQARRFKTKAKNAQEAHEAIRPTSVQREPSALKDDLTADQFKLYQLIWMRTVACQMIHASLDTVALDLSCGEGNTFRATGSTLVNPGFLAVYEEGKDDAKAEERERHLPSLSVGQEVALQGIRPEQHFTEPPPRYSEASLVKALEEYGIGRPSTYATIISTLLAREYVTLEQRRFHPTDVGRVVNKFLTGYFAAYVDYEFTARLEDELDAVSRGEEEWTPLMEAFWGPFKERIKTTAETVNRQDILHEELEEACPKCGQPLSIRLGRRGRFIGCTGFPQCDYTRSLGESEATPAEPEVVEGRRCPQCGSPLHIKQGRYGKFIGCSNYPSCKHIEPLEKPTDTGVQCPQCAQGTLLKRKSRRGKVFYSCSRYPNCKYAVWNEPLNEPCLQCGWPILTLKTTKRRGTEKVCPQKDCDFAVPVELPPAQIS